MATEPISSRMAVALPRSPSPENHTPPRGMGAYQGKSIVRRPDSPSKFPGLIERVHSRVRPDELYKEDIVRSIFGDVGAPLEGDKLSCGGSSGGGDGCCCYGSVFKGFWGVLL